MIRSWTLVLLEFILFLAGLSSVTYLVLEPHVKRNFVVVLERKTGFSVEVESVLFSPFGKIKGKNIKFISNEETQGLVLRCQEFSLDPKESILKELWEKQDQFNWEDLRYNIEAKNIDIDRRGQESGYSISEINGDLDEQNLKAELTGFVMTLPNGYVLLEELSLELLEKDWKVQLENFIFAHGEAGEWTCASMFVSGWRPPSFEDWLKASSPHVWINALDDMRWIDVKGISPQGQFDVEGLRLVGMGENTLQLSSQGEINGVSFSIGGKLEHHVESWSSEIDVDSNALDSPIELKANSGWTTTGPWTLTASDEQSVFVKVDVTREEQQRWVCTLTGELDKFTWLNSEWSAISGELRGGCSYQKSKLRTFLSGEKLEGGPGKTLGGYFDLIAEGDLKQQRWKVEQFKVGEKNRWEGQANGEVELDPIALKSFDLDVSGFPLGQYSPKVDGDLDIKGAYEDQQLKVSVNTAALLPDKDLSQQMEDFSVHVDVSQDDVLYVQKFLQRSIEHEIRVRVKTKELLVDPMRIRDGELVELLSISPLFELKLTEPVPVKINAEGVQAEHFEIDDTLLRLRHLKGEAYIPFLRPSQLSIKADGHLDLAKMPPIGEHRCSGLVTIKGATWDKGWSLRNLDAPLMSQNLTVTPSALFPPMSGELEGRLFERCLTFDRLELRGRQGEKIWGSGNYHLRKKDIFATLQGTNLLYQHKDYRILFDAPRFKVEGPPSTLKLEGEMDLKDFLYSGDFEFMGSREGGTRHIAKPPESQSIHHEMKLKVVHSGPLRCDNNASQLSFGIEELWVHGPLEQLRWKGKVKSIEGASNRLFLPFQWLDVGFDANALELVFDDEQDWNPKLHLRGEALVDGVQVFLGVDDHISELQQGRFQLKSNPSYPRDEILALLSSGERSDEKLVEDTVSDLGREESGTSVTLIKSPIRSGDGQSNRLTYRAGLSGGVGNPFEFRIDYRLGKHLGLELSQTNDDKALMGLRYSKQAQSLSEFFIKDDFVEAPQERDTTEVKWSLHGLVESGGLGMKSELLKVLLPLEPLLLQGRYDEAREQMNNSIKQVLSDKGYASAAVNVKWLNRTVTPLYRRGEYRGVTREKIHIALDVQLGPLISCTEVQLKQWPPHVPKPKSSWLRASTLRHPVFKKGQLEQFKSELLTQLSQRGYLGAEIKSVLLEPIPKEREVELDGPYPFVVISDHKKDMNRGAIPHRLIVDLAPGKIHRFSQMVLSGVNHWSVSEAMAIMDFERDRIYSDRHLDKMLERLKARYKNEGYFGTRVGLSQVLKSRRYPRVSIHIQVDEGERWRQGQIKFEGLVHSDLDIVKASVVLVEHEMAHPKLLESSLRRLSALPQISTVDYRWEEQVDGVRSIVFSVTETPLWRLSSRLGFEKEDGLQFALGLQRENLWGRGESVSFENLFSKRETSHVMRYHWLQGERNERKAQILLGYQKDLISDLEFENRTSLLGVSLLDAKPAQKWGLDFFIQEDKNLSGTIPTLRIRSSFRRSSAPAPEQPGRGWGWGIKNQWVAYVKEERYAYIGEVRLSYGWKLGKTMLTPWSRMGHRVALGKSFDLPLADRFFLGGTGSLRGYAEDEIGGDGERGGQAFVAGGLEWFFPMSEWFDGSLFYEMGQVNDDRLMGGESESGRSIGMGLLFRTPVGPIEAFYAHPIVEKGLGNLGLQLGTIF